jgi:hypothetical protein
MPQLIIKTILLFLLFAIHTPVVSAQQTAKRADTAEAGFYQIEPVTFSMQQADRATIRQTSSEARIWYSYHPARPAVKSPAEPLNKPLFVILNGGPGSATSTNLFSMNTAPYTLDKTITGPKPGSYAVNTNSWTVMGNLLYIDAPNTGFSYNVLNNSDLAARARDFATSYNPYIDAAQVLRVVLRFLKEHPELKAGQVQLVGESYGATRASIMLNMLLFYPGYRDGSRIYADPALVAEIEQHFRSIISADDAAAIKPETIAGQFGRQIFIQPQLTGVHQDDLTGEMFEKPGSVIDAIDSGVKGRPRYTRSKDSLCNKPMWATYYIHFIAGRDEYNYTKPNTWGDDLEAHAMSGLLDVNVLSTLLDHDVKKIPLLRPEARNGKGAYRDLCACTTSDPAFDNEYLKYFLGVSPNQHSRENIQLLLDDSSSKRIGSQLKGDTGSTLEEQLGRLDMMDDYLLGHNSLLYIGYKYNTFTAAGYDINQDSSAIYGELFLQNLPLVKTFITDAELDLVIYSPALPLSFEKYTAIVKSVAVSRGSKTSAGSFTINYKPGSLQGITTPDSITIYYPYYGGSGHSVSSTEPQKLLTDIRKWLLM